MNKDFTEEEICVANQHIKKFSGLPWCSSCYDSVLSLQRSWVPSLVGELRSPRLCGAAKKKEKRLNLISNHTRVNFTPTKIF